MPDTTPANREKKDNSKMHPPFFYVSKKSCLAIALFAVGLELGGVRVTSAAQAPTPTPTSSPAPVIQLVSPKVTYPAKGETHYNLSVMGANFGTDRTKIRVFLDDNLVPVQWITDKAQAKEGANVFGFPNDDGTQLDLWLPWSTYKGVFKLKVANGDRISAASAEVIVSKVESKSKAAWLAALVTAVLLGLPLVLVSRTTGPAYSVGDKHYGVLAAFFLDNETDTYSLSKFQFYLWTAVGVFGYVYLALAESLVQGKAVFPEIPENLPAIIFVSATTTALAAGITTARGPKGSGDIHPSMADFISAGGVVVSERFQFFVWTLLGAVTFLFYTISSDPATLHDLPKIPDSFLQIMGISSLGYLGGKLARKPGPVIDNIHPEPTVSTVIKDSLQLTVTGQKLSQHPTLRIGSDEVKLDEPPPPGQSSSPAVAAAPGETKAKLTSSKEETGEFCNKLLFAIMNPKAAWITPGKHKVTITNDDGKAASWDYMLT